MLQQLINASALCSLSCTWQRPCWFVCCVFRLSW